jgi:hypothetical protein
VGFSAQNSIAWKNRRQPEKHLHLNQDAALSIGGRFGQLEHFQVKWRLVHRPEVRQINKIERFRDST